MRMLKVMGHWSVTGLPGDDQRPRLHCLNPTLIRDITVDKTGDTLILINGSILALVVEDWCPACLSSAWAQAIDPKDKRLSMSPCGHAQ